MGAGGTLPRGSNFKENKKKVYCFWFSSIPGAMEHCVRNDPFLRSRGDELMDTYGIPASCISLPL